ncbi:MAG: aromatic ring-hydroxylating dioxygenase subunit alpha [Halioglobus sp.]
MLPPQDDSAERLAREIQLQQTRKGSALPSYFYQSNHAYRSELENLLLRSWIYAAHISQLAKAGDYLLLDVGADSIILVRAANDEIHALVNSCRHRGARVCEAAQGNRKTFVCPYHGWVYDLDGSLRAAREMSIRPDFDASSLGLKALSISIFHGLIFVNADPDCEPFSQALAPLEASLGAYDLANAKIAHQQTYTVDANWKLCLENYLECYHCATSHRAYARMHTLKDLPEASKPVVDAMLARCESVTGVEGIGDEIYQVYEGASAFGACVSHQRYGLYEGYLTGSEDGQPVAPLMGQMQGYDGGVGDFQMGPVSFMLNYPDHCVLYRFLPLAIDRTAMEVVWFVAGEAREGVDYSRDKVSWLWHNTTLEDEYIISRNSAGVHSLLFEPGPLQPEFEQMLVAFHEWYLAHLTGQATP